MTGLDFQLHRSSFYIATISTFLVSSMILIDIAFFLFLSDLSSCSTVPALFCYNIITGWFSCPILSGGVSKLGS